VGTAIEVRLEAALVPAQAGNNYKPGELRYTGDFQNGFGDRMTVCAVETSERRMPGFQTGRLPSTSLITVVAKLLADFFFAFGDNLRTGG
jgi:hypothetical protein